MKLLIVIYSLGPGGAERVTINLANYWAAEGCDVTLVTVASAHTDSYELATSVRRIALGLDSISGGTFCAIAANFIRVRALRRLLRQLRPDVAIGMMSAASVLLGLAAWRLKGIITIGSERTYPPMSPLGFLWDIMRRNIYAFLDVIVTQTEKGRDWVAANTKAKAVAVIPNPVQWPIPVHNPILKPAEYLARDRHHLLAVGRLGPEKGFDKLIEAFALLANDFPNWNLCILGEGPLREMLESLIHQYDLADRVLLPGYVGNVAEWYVASDLFVLSSHFEGFPNALLEAMASGLPVVSFDCDTGPRDLIRHEINGLLVAPGDTKALAAALRRSLNDEPFRRRLGARAQSLKYRFSVDQIQLLWMSLFKEFAK